MASVVPPAFQALALSAAATWLARWCAGSLNPGLGSRCRPRALAFAGAGFVLDAQPLFFWLWRASFQPGPIVAVESGRALDQLLRLVLRPFDALSSLGVTSSVIGAKGTGAARST